MSCFSVNGNGDLIIPQENNTTERTNICFNDQGVCIEQIIYGVLWSMINVADW